jgi:hypothetical protein
LAENNLGERVLPEGWTEAWKPDYSGKEYTHTDGREQDLHPAKPEGIVALAAAIPGMGPLIKLDISGNNIGGEQEGELQRICVASGIELTK